MIFKSQQKEVLKRQMIHKNDFKEYAIVSTEKSIFNKLFKEKRK